METRTREENDCTNPSLALPHHHLTLTPSCAHTEFNSEIVKQLYDAIIEQDNQLANLMKYVTEHAEIGSVKDAIAKGDNIKPDFSLALQRLDRDHLIKLKGLLEARADYMGYVSPHTLLKNAGLVVTPLSLAYFIPFIAIPVAIFALGYVTHQHKKVVWERLHWLLSDVNQALHYYFYYSSLPPSSNAYETALTATPHSSIETVTEQSILNTRFSFFNAVPTAPFIENEEGAEHHLKL